MNPGKIMANVWEGQVVGVEVTKESSHDASDADPHLTIKIDGIWRIIDASSILEDNEAR